MTLTLHFHPLSSFSHKVLIAVAEKCIAFEPVVIDFGNPDSAAAFRKLWPMAKMPVLVDEARGETVAESTVIIEYLDQHFGGPKLFPTDQNVALKARFWDRFYDLHVHMPMQKIVTDKIRLPEQSDALGVEQARAQIRQAYGVIEDAMAGRTWALGETFGVADCTAAPALLYAGVAEPIGAEFPLTAAYRERLMARPSYTKILRQAEPFFAYFPLPTKPDISHLK